MRKRSIPDTRSEKERRDNILSAAMFVLRHKCSIRQASKALGINFLRMHNDLTEGLSEVNPVMRKSVKKVIFNCFRCRHDNGTKRVLFVSNNFLQ